MKKYAYIFSGLLFASMAVGVIVFESKWNYYKVAAEEVYSVTENKQISINEEAIKQKKDSILLICLSDNTEQLIADVKQINILATDMLNAENRKRLKKHSGVIVLQSDNMELAAKAWVLLSRVGVSDIKIWSEETEEPFKYTFQPDTITELK